MHTHAHLANQADMRGGPPNIVLIKKVITIARSHKIGYKCKKTPMYTTSVLSIMAERKARASAEYFKIATP